MNGEFYGTTAAGGDYQCYITSGPSGCGTIFAVNTEGKERVVHIFDGEPDGVEPEGGLIVFDGLLYGTTALGGKGCEYDSGAAPGCGTLFVTSDSGNEKVLYSFKGGKTDGAEPVGSLTPLGKTFYGTTYIGGSTSCYGYGCGSIFEVDPSGKEHMLYRFRMSVGEHPDASLLALSANFFGTTYEGGQHGGNGTVFAITTSGKLQWVSTFRYPGALPQSRLIALNGMLYGTTSAGGRGSSSDCLGFCGTVFEVSKAGKERVIYTFTGPPDGAEPEAGLVALNGRLYGTTAAGGAGKCDQGGVHGCGTVFEMSRTGKEQILYRFKGGVDGAYPAADLIASKETLYGTTYGGGKGHVGTVFSLTP
jgi:uncharacterized repeat protein (TIGR03803 family)